MKIIDVINLDQIELDISCENKDELFTNVSNRLVELNIIKDSKVFSEALHEREKDTPTGFGENWAIPHALSDTVQKAAVVFVRLDSPIEYTSLEGNSADKFFFIAIPNSLASEHVKILGSVATLLMNTDFKNDIINASTKQEVLTAIQQHSVEKEKENSKVEGSKHIVAITACTTGIAHTYMAATALEDAARSLGYTINVEKQGAAGVEDALTHEMIKNADAVILAVEKGINENRFSGKPILKVSPGKAIKEAELVIDNALNEKGTYTKSTSDTSDTVETTGNVKNMYSHLLAGVSHMIPVVVAGGLAIALSFAFGITAFEVEGSLPWALFEIGSKSALALMFPVLAGFIAYDIADKPGFAPGIIGGFIAANSGSGFVGAILAGYLAGYIANFINKKVKFPNSLQGLKVIVVLPLVTTLIVGLLLLFVVAGPMTALQEKITIFLNGLADNNAGIVLISLVFSVLYFDLGGPISKMVYSFAVATLATGIYTTMSAAMIIGMVPPLGMAIATMVKPNLFKPDEREAGKTALLLGMSFITEGAIPFAISYPKQAIPSFMIGGFVGSLISLALNIGVTAPHGGLFLVFIPNAITNPLLFVLALAAGSIVSALVMILLMQATKKKA